MIIVNFKGGLGNQMFQYALGRHLAIKNKDSLKLDISGLERARSVGDTYRSFDLDAFNIKKAIASTEETKRLKYPFGILSRIWNFITFKMSADKNVIFHPKMLRKHGDVYVDGFWQSPEYFEAIRETILQDYTLSLPSDAYETWAKRISHTENAVSLHVRRGDYAKNISTSRDFGLCSISYYEKAIKYIQQHVVHQTFFIFSDEIEWVKKNVPLPSDSIYVHDSNLSAPEELLLMSMCTHNIIANSSFSWWGAWLNSNKEKIVVAPTPWFNTIRYDKQLIPHSWIQLPK